MLLLVPTELYCRHYRQKYTLNLLTAELTLTAGITSLAACKCISLSLLCWPKYWEDYLGWTSWQYLQLKPTLIELRGERCSVTSLPTPDCPGTPAASFRHAQQSLSSPLSVAHHHHLATSPPHWLATRAGLWLVAGLAGVICLAGRRERRWGCNGYIAGGIILPNYQSPAHGPQPSHCTLLHQTILLKYFYRQFPVIQN